MELRRAISKAFELFSPDIVCEKRFVNILDDMAAFCQVRAFKNIILNLQRGNHLKVLLTLNDELSIQNFAYKYANIEGYREDLIYQIASAFSYAYAEYIEKHLEKLEFISNNSIKISIENSQFILNRVTSRDSICQCFHHDYSDLYMATTPVTFEQWYDIMGYIPKDNDSGLNDPITHISYEDVIDFCDEFQELSSCKIKIPTFKERLLATTKIEYRCLYDFAWYADNSDFSIHPVAKKSPNEMGLFDMLGNVYEWCNINNNNDYPLIGGGSFYSTPRECLKPMEAGVRCSSDDIGFRIAMYYK